MKHTAIFLSACLIASCIFALLYRYDNKYTARAVVSPDGLTHPNHAVLAGDHPVFLADGWELYPDELLSPEELRQGTHSPQKVFIGQYQSLSAFHENRSPYGAATYRLFLQTDEDLDAVLLLQEVFSACRVFINGVPVTSAGTLDPYRPQVKDLTTAISLGGTTEILVQTLNRTHYYSGITYPPVLGTSEAIRSLVFTRTLFYCFLCFSALTLSLFSAAVWYGNRQQGGDKVPLWFGLMSLSFAVRVSYPFVCASGLTWIRPFYALEDMAFLFGVWCALNITLCFAGLEKTATGRLLSRISLHAVLIGAVFSPLVLPPLPAFAPVYGQIIYWYKLLSAVVLAGLSFLSGLHRRPYSGWLLAGVGVYGSSLLAHVVILNRFEPARAGWPDEYGGFCLVVCFAVMMALENFRLVRENIRLRSHLQEEVTEKTRSLNAVLEERRQFLAGAAHDLKAPMTSLQLFVQAVEDGGIGLDPDTETSLRMIRLKSGEMQERLAQIQIFAMQDAQPLCMASVDLTQLVRSFHEMNLPDMEAAGVAFTLRLPRQPCVILGDRLRLNRILQNLVYNALSFTPMDGTIALTLALVEDEAVLRVSDTGCGILPQDLPHIFDRFFSRREDGDGSGLGLYLVKIFLRDLGGEIAVESQVGKGTVFTIRLPLEDDSGSHRQ